MAQRDDILLPGTAPPPEPKPATARLAAFVPIAIAVFGIAVVLFGGVTARGPAFTAGAPAVDGIATGSIESAAP
jgi:hypothetical protein